MTAKHSRNWTPVLISTQSRTMLPCTFMVLIVLFGMTGLLKAQNGSGIANPYGPAIPGVSTLNQGSMGSGSPNSTSSSQGIQILGGGQSTQSPPSGITYPDPNQYVLSPGDLIAIRLYAVSDYAPVVRVSKDGTVLLPLIGSVNLGGITLRQAEELVATRLKTAGMYRNPEVTIGIAESSSPQTISFVGEKNGLYLVQGQRSLLDVIAGSGGLPPNASRTISIIRPGVETPIVVNLGSTPQDFAKANVPIFAHDTIFIERSGAVYVLGAFKQQGAFSIPPGTNMTLMQAASLAGGPLFAGKYSDMRIVRTVGTERQEVKVDIKRIMFGLDPDPLLQSGDILFLPNNSLKQALSSGGLQALLSAVSILVIAVYQGR